MVGPKAVITLPAEYTGPALSTVTRIILFVDKRSGIAAFEATVTLVALPIKNPIRLLAAENKERQPPVELPSAIVCSGSGKLVVSSAVVPITKGPEPLFFLATILEPGIVMNTSLVPAVKFTALPVLLLTVLVRVRVVPVEFTDTSMTSH
jgi:hypothetical protein